MVGMEIALWLAWLIGGLIALAVGHVWPILGAILMLPVLLFALCWPSARHSRNAELKRGEFPLLFRMADEERMRLNHVRRLRIFLCESGAGAFIGPYCDGILISPAMLAILTRDELRQVLRHELAHLSSREVRREIRWQRLAGRAVHANLCTLRLLPILSPILFLAGLKFVRMQRKYQAGMQPRREREADRHLDPVHAAAAIAKAEFANRIEEAAANRAFSGMPELRRFCWKMIAQNGDAWLKEADAQDDDPHPEMRERNQSPFDPYQKEIDPAWINEINRIPKV